MNIGIETEEGELKKQRVYSAGLEAGEAENGLFIVDAGCCCVIYSKS